MMKHLLCLLLFFLPQISNAQWTRTGGLPGGSVSKLITSGDTVVANMGGEMYWTGDAGENWTLLPTPPGFIILKSCIQGPEIYLLAYPTPERRIAYSDDFGQSWSYNSYPDSMTFQEMFVSNGYLYGSDSKGVYRSADHGASWDYTVKKSVSHLRSEGQRLVGNRLGCIVQSTDGGFNWDTLLNFTGNVIDILLHENYCFAFLQNANQGCWVSDDFGQNWVNHIGTGFDQVYEVFWHDGKLIGLKINQLLVSNDLGLSWDQDYLDLPGLPAYSGVSIGSVMLIGGAISGVFRSSDDGSNWTPVNNGIEASGGNRLHQSDGVLFTAAHGGIFQVDAVGENWQLLPYNPDAPGLDWNGFTDIVKNGDNLIISDGSSPWYSTDGGLSWSPSALEGFGSFYNFPQLDLAGDKVFAYADFHDFSAPFQRSNNGGAVFEQPQALYDQFEANAYSYVFDAGRIYALSLENRIYRSIDAAHHWQILSDSVPFDAIGQDWLPSSSHPFLVAGNTILILDYYGTTGKGLVSNNLGGTWQIVDYGSNSAYPWGQYGFNTLKSVGNKLIAATQNAILLSTDGGLSWTNWDDGLPGFWEATLEIHDGYLWAGLNGGGIWKRPLSDLGLLAATGTVFHDLNLNGVQDAGEPGLPNLIVQSTLSNAYAISNPDGTYALFTSNTDETIEVVLPAAYWTASPATQTVSLPVGDLNFALSVDPSAKDLSVSLVNASPFQPGFETNLTLFWRNKVPVPASDVVLSLSFPSDLLEYLSAVPAPTSQSAGALSWNLGNLAPDAHGAITISLRTPASVLFGTEICLQAAIAPLAGDLAPGDNNRQLCRQVVGSYDPNDKQSDPPANITPTEIADGKRVVYTIRFQNLGNYPASFIRITDTLDAAFNPGTFQFLGSSHPCSWTLLNEGAMEFYFHNIQLPPASADEPGSHGFVQYAVQPRPNQPLGTVLRNTAHIFFDYNAPVVTNTTSLEISQTSAVASPEQASGMYVYPNPAHGAVQVVLPGSGILSATAGDGRLLMKQPVTQGALRLDVSGWAAGRYLLVLESGGKRYEAALVVL